MTVGKRLSSAIYVSRPLPDSRVQERVTAKFVAKTALTTIPTIYKSGDFFLSTNREYREIFYFIINTIYTFFFLSKRDKRSIIPSRHTPHLV